MNCKIHKLFWAITFSYTVITSHSQTQNLKSDSYILTSGAAAESDGRNWSSDAGFLTRRDNSLTATAKSQDPSLPSTVPYLTARIFKSESSYRFSVSPNSRHWIRLHFYPSSYGDFDSLNSFFSVTTGGFSLLHNFSAASTGEALTQAYIIREFATTRLETGVLDVTFTPSHSSFAFINGIEVIPMPEIFHSVSFSDKNMDLRFCAMQTMVRLNVGGQYIRASHDSGARTWYDDSPYIYGAAFGVTSEADKDVSIVYPSTESRFTAPSDVYRTGRNMGPNSTLNMNYNLTWIFEVDLDFTYLVRLHFCEYHFEKINQRVFRVFINNRTAEVEADVIGWTGGRGVTVHKDYTTFANSESGDDHLWLALHPHSEGGPEYYDAILNGVEIFKLNDTRGNLAGPNPVPAVPGADSQHVRVASPRKTGSNGTVIGSVLGSLGGLGLILGLVAFLKHRVARDKMESSSGTTGAWLPIWGSSRSKGTATSSQISSLGGGLFRHFALAEIRRATDDFSESSIIGVGGFGKVYKGLIDGNMTEVAIKRASPCSEQGLREFLNEIELLSKLRHRHLVSLIGACEENNEMILVYDYMSNGTLRQHLYNNNDNNPVLSWKNRLGICIGAARGIHYLHTGAKNPIIHRDVKCTNILLDEKWVAKVSDFGLSKTGHTLNQTYVSSVVKGSFGYLDPEYFKRQRLTDKSDVYSFGVVLLEVLSGRPALNPSLPKEEVSLADWAVLNHRRGSIEEILDPHIEGQISPECLKHFTETTMKCLNDNGLDRPSMGEVLWNLEHCLQLLHNPNGPNMAAQKKADDAYAMHEMLKILEDQEGEKTDECNHHSSSAVL